MNTDKKLLVCLYGLLLSFISAHVVVVWIRNHHSEFNLGNPHYCHMWIALGYAFLIAFSYVIEQVIISGSKNHSYFKDITLEFQGLPLNLTEKEFMEKCEKIMEKAVIEVSFIYDLNEYFKAKN